VLIERKALARREIEHFANLIEEQPMGVQVGIVLDTLPHTGFQLIRQPSRRCLVLSPFRLGGEPNVSVGVAMITSAPDAIALHEKAVTEMWARALKGPAALACIRQLLDNASVGKIVDFENFQQVSINGPDDARHLTVRPKRLQQTSRAKSALSTTPKGARRPLD